MTKRTLGTTSRIAAIAVGLSNLVSFSLGIALAGRHTSQRAEQAAPAWGVGGSAAGVGTLFGSHMAGDPLPIAGKGMWIYEFTKVGHDNPQFIVDYAKKIGLTHLYVRSGSSIVGTRGWRDIRRILPVAHAAGLKVIAWDFPYLRNINADVRRAMWVLRARVGAHRVDGFAADVETASEGTKLTRYRARLYATRLRAHTPGKFLVLVPPRPNSYTTSFYPYDILVPRFDAVAPMVYWGRQAPAQATAWALAYLNKFGKPVAPIGQSYDMGPWGGPKGPPKDGAVVSFMNESKTKGAIGVSFWSWQHTPSRLWHTIRAYDWPGGQKPI